MTAGTRKAGWGTRKRGQGAGRARSIAGWLGGVLLAPLFFAGSVFGSADYSGCESCHGAFDRGNYTSLVDGTSWGGPLMDRHVEWVNGTCTACHMQEGPGAVYLADSGDTTFTNGCVGCHGREADVTDECTGRSTSPFATQHCGSGAGLRALHELKVEEGTCTSCHTNDPEPVGEQELPWNFQLAASAVRNSCDEDGTESRFGAFGLDNDGDGRRDANDPDCQFPINPGLNDAWYNPDTNGQGFLIVIFDNTVFVAWFTFDTELASADATPVLGHPGHRWLTAQGPFDGDTAALDLFLTSGGRFDRGDPPVNAPEKVGTLTLQFADCRNAIVGYDIPGVGSNTLQIQRISQANIPLCEMLVESTGAE